MHTEEREDLNSLLPKSRRQPSLLVKSVCLTPLAGLSIESSQYHGHDLNFGFPRKLKQKLMTTLSILENLYEQIKPQVLAAITPYCSWHTTSLSTSFDSTPASVAILFTSLLVFKAKVKMLDLFPYILY